MPPSRLSWEHIYRQAKDLEGQDRSDHGVIEARGSMLAACHELWAVAALVPETSEWMTHFSVEGVMNTDLEGEKGCLDPAWIGILWSWRFHLSLVSAHRASAGS